MNHNNGLIWSNTIDVVELMSSSNMHSFTVPGDEMFEMLQNLFATYYGLFIEAITWVDSQ
jgi:hypothetical protein